MAIMIPSDISPDIKSNAEKHIFNWFKYSPCTDNWVVLHSLGITNHNRVIHGEVDLFVLVPELGLFALEVKGGRVERKNGIWLFTDKYDHTDSRVKGPFDQAWEGIYSIRKSLAEKFDNEHKYLKKMFFGIGVMFPDVEYESVGIDEEQWQVFDCNDGKNVKKYIERIAEGSKKGWQVQNGVVKKENRPSEEDVCYLADLLRGDFDRKASLNVLYNYAEEELVLLTKNQYRCIDQLEDNPRCLIKGAAGTGKTLIAVEQVKRLVAQGKKAAFFCYNNNLGQWLKNYFNHQPENLQPVYVGTLHGYMIKVLMDHRIAFDFPSNPNEKDYFFSITLPELAMIPLKTATVRFDSIVVDEAQDLISDDYLSFFSVCLKRGFQRGNWFLFGDFSRQAIYTEKTESEIIKLLEDRTAFIRFKLSTNCRNTGYICQEIKTVTGFFDEISYSGEVCGPPVEYIPYDSLEDEKQKLVCVIKKLKDNHVDVGRITILSPRKRNNSVVNELERIKVLDYSVPAPEELTFCTIQSFKGLENTVVILTDIDSYQDVQLMYVALSRARSGLYVLESRNAEREYIELYIRGNK